MQPERQLDIIVQLQVGGWFCSYVVRSTIGLLSNSYHFSYVVTCAPNVLIHHIIMAAAQQILS